MVCRFACLFFSLLLFSPTHIASGMDRMSYQTPLKRVYNCFAFNFLEYDSSIPSIVEGRVHPIQFGHSITRINLAARTHRDKCLCLLILFTLALLVIIVYPFVDLTYYLFVILVFVPLSILEYITWCFFKVRTLKLLRAAVEQENEIFVTNGMKLIWHEKSKEIVIEVVRRVSLSYENPILLQKSIREQEKRYSNEFSTPPTTPSASSSTRRLSSSLPSSRRTSVSHADQERAPLLSFPTGRSEIEVDDVLTHPPPPSHFSSPSHVQIPIE